MIAGVGTGLEPPRRQEHQENGMGYGSGFLLSLLLLVRPGVPSLDARPVGRRLVRRSIYTWPLARRVPAPRTSRRVDRTEHEAPGYCHEPGLSRAQTSAWFPVPQTDCIGERSPQRHRRRYRI